MRVDADEANVSKKRSGEDADAPIGFLMRPILNRYRFDSD